jgi:hypothetical protein
MKAYDLALKAPEMAGFSAVLRPRTQINHASSNDNRLIGHGPM